MRPLTHSASQAVHLSSPIFYVHSCVFQAAKDKLSTPFLKNARTVTSASRRTGSVATARWANRIRSGSFPHPILHHYRWNLLYRVDGVDVAQETEIN